MILHTDPIRKIRKDKSVRSLIYRQIKMNYSLKEHFNHYDEDASKYMGEALRIFTDKMLSKSAGLTTKSHILTVLIQNRDDDRFKRLHSVLDLPEVVRAIEILDSERAERQIQGKIVAHPSSTKLQKKLISVRGIRGGVNGMSFCLSKIKIVKEWVRSIPKEKIEYRAMLFSPDLWRKLADLTHLNPRVDFAEGCEWFLPYCFGAQVAEGSIVHDYKHMQYNNFFEMYDKHNFSYELIRAKLKLDPLSVRSLNASDKAYARNIKINIVNRENLNTDANKSM